MGQSLTDVRAAAVIRGERGRLHTRPGHYRKPGPVVDDYTGNDPDAMNGVPLIWCDDCRRWFQTGTMLVHLIVTHAPALSKGSPEMRETA